MVRVPGYVPFLQILVPYLQVLVTSLGLPTQILAAPKPLQTLACPYRARGNPQGSSTHHSYSSSQSPSHPNAQHFRVQILLTGAVVPPWRPAWRLDGWLNKHPRTATTSDFATKMMLLRFLLLVPEV